MPIASTPSVPAPVAAVKDDPHSRIPKTRMGLILIVPVTGKSPGTISITETQHGGMVTLKDSAGIERDLILTVAELRELAKHANRIATMVLTRPDWKP
jgi:hypothetical protein